MIGLDTNVIVRYIAQDDEMQSAQTSILIESMAHAAQYEYTLTFDQGAAKHAGIRLINAY